MSIREEFETVIDEIRNILPGHPDYYDFPSVQEEIALFSRNLKDTIDFLDHDCKKNQLAWMSDVFSQISANLKSWEFIDALHRAARRLFKKTDRDLFIRYCIPDAERGLPKEIYRERFPEQSENNGRGNQRLRSRNFKQELVPIFELHKICGKENRCDPGLPDYRKTTPAILAEIAVLSRNLQDTVNFLNHSCTGEQLAWMSEVFEEISANLKSWEFIDALYRAAEKAPRISMKFRIKDRISDAAGFLPDEIYFQRFPDHRGKSKQPWNFKSKICFNREYEAIIRRIEKLDDHPVYFEMPAIMSEIELFSRNLQDTVNFLDHECTAQQLIWMSEVFDEVSTNLKSWEFIDALDRAADRFPEACSEYNIRNSIGYAEGALPETVIRQRYPDFVIEK